MVAGTVEHVFARRSGPDTLRDRTGSVFHQNRLRLTIVVYFYFPAKLERKWSLYRPDVDRLFQLYEIAEDDEAFVQIDFGEADAELELPAY